jgi:thiol-disulfide isomerase/thioredoxin
MHFVVKSNPDSRRLCKNMKKGNWMVLYKANWCGHCKTLQPQWNYFVKDMKKHPNLNLAEVESNFIPAMKHSIGGYPTIKMFHNNRPVAEFNDSRDVMGLKRFALSNMLKHRDIVRRATKPKRKVTLVVKLSRKPSTKKSVTRKPVVRKPVVRKPVVRKPSDKKSVTRKPVSRKPSTKKSVTRKPSAKKSKKRTRKSSNNNLVTRMKKRRMKTQKPTSSLEILKNLKKSMSNIQKQSIHDKKLLKTLESIKSL